MKSRGFFQAPQDIMEKYNACSVPQYTRYRWYERVYEGAADVSLTNALTTWIDVVTKVWEVAPSNDGVMFILT